MPDDISIKNTNCSECPFLKPPMLMSLMILYAVLLHLIWGITIIIDPSSSKTTSTAFLGEMFSSHIIVGMIYITTGILASFSLFGNPSKLKFIFALLQQSLLIQSSFSAIKCMISGQFADGVVRPIPFIIADQSSIVITMLLHSVALIRMSSRIFSVSFLKRVKNITNYDNS